MKKLIFLGAVLFFVSLTSFVGRRVPPTGDVFILTLSSQELQVLWYALKKSNAEHSLVGPLEEKIQEQVNQQLKAKQDSLPKEISPTKKKQ